MPLLLGVILDFLSVAIHLSSFFSIKLGEESKLKNNFFIRTALRTKRHVLMEKFSFSSGFPMDFL